MTLLETQVLERLRALPTDKQQEVLDFVEFLATRSQGHTSNQMPPAQLDPFVAAQQLRDAIKVRGEPLSADIIKQRAEARY